VRRPGPRSKGRYRAKDPFPRLRRPGLSERIALIGGAEIDAADNRRGAVGYQNLAMIAIVSEWETFVSRGLTGLKETRFKPLSFRRSKNAVGVLLDP
jgi:hypothetical protein